MDDEGGDGAAVIRDLRAWLDDWKVDAKIIAASVRGPADVRRAVPSWIGQATLAAVPRPA